MVTFSTQWITIPETAVTLFLLQGPYLQYVLQHKAIPLRILDAPKDPIAGTNWT